MASGLVAFGIDSCSCVSEEKSVLVVCVEKPMGDGLSFGECSFSTVVSIRDRPEFEHLRDMNRGSWPRCVAWNGWLPGLSGDTVGSLWTVNAGEGVGYQNLNPHLVHSGSCGKFVLQALNLLLKLWLIVRLRIHMRGLMVVSIAILSRVVMCSWCSDLCLLFCHCLRSQKVLTGWMHFQRLPLTLLVYPLLP